MLGSVALSDSILLLLRKTCTYPHIEGTNLPLLEYKVKHPFLPASEQFHLPHKNQMTCQLGPWTGAFTLKYGWGGGRVLCERVVFRIFV